MTADISPAQQYYEGVNPDLLYRIPVQATTVLEVGCGAGALGEAYKAINPDATYIGLELMPEPAERARKRLDHVLQVNVELTPRPVLPDGIERVDCLVYGDVIEHLGDPLAVLQEQLEWLKPNGLLLACIPNVQHWSTLAHLLQGQWPQKDHGLFDRTHKHWFTRQGMAELIQAAGLVVHDITPRIFQPEKAKQFVERLAPSLPGLGVEPQELLAGVAPLQYVVRAGRTAARPLLLSGLLMKPQAGMNEVRMLQPLRSVGSSPGVLVESSHQGLKLLPAQSPLPRILIFQRQSLSYAESLPMLRKALAAGYVLVSEFDDDPAHFPAIASNCHLNFTAMHAVQVSTEPLAAVIREHNPEVAVFANAVEDLPNTANTPWPESGDGRPLQMFFGALNREKDWEPVIIALNDVFTSDPDGWAVNVVHDQAFFEAVQCKTKRFTPTCNYSAYRQVMAGCHIAFLPLRNTAFNQKKSDLKLVEAASHGLAAVASHVVYGSALIDGDLGRLYTNGNELTTILREWRSKPSEAKLIGQRAREWVKGNRLQCHQSGVREAWYRQLWERREALTAELIARVPELQA